MESHDWSKDLGRDWKVKVVKRRWFGFLKAIPEGGNYPRGYGVAWREHYGDRNYVWCSPWPTGWVAGRCAHLYWQLRRGFRPHELAMANEELVALRAEVRMLRSAEHMDSLRCWEMQDG